MSTAYACTQCKKVLCFEHYYGKQAGPRLRKDGLCARCARVVRELSEKAGQA
ncbi:MAG: hypothetical protein GX141_04425 [Armatimonadetes bacterium]|nr:hypothetical protein [Armatimonadota bacterium]